MAKSRQLALMKGGLAPGENAPIGTRREVRELLARFNTAPDGDAAKGMGTERLYGPGMAIDLSTSSDQVNQALVSVNEDDIAWPVLLRICKELKWKMVDLETGRSFG